VIRPVQIPVLYSQGSKIATRQKVGGVTGTLYTTILQFASSISFIFLSFFLEWQKSNLITGSSG